MEAKNHHDLLQPLLLSSTGSTDDHDQEHNNHSLISSNLSIVLRLSLVVLVAFVSIWANHEASKGFVVSIVNESNNTLAGKRFELFYVSNDEATRLVLRASKLVENYLYPENECYNDDHQLPKKQVNHVILKLGSDNSTDTTHDRVVVVEPYTDNKFVVRISPSVMEGTGFRNAIFQAVQRVMVHVWLWNGQGQAPANLVNGIVEYIASKLVGSGTIATFDLRDKPDDSGCWRRREPTEVMEFLDYCERRSPGFVRRLNQAMKDDWQDDTLDIALGLSIRNMCTTYNSLRYNYSSV